MRILTTIFFLLFLVSPLLAQDEDSESTGTEEYSDESTYNAAPSDLPVTQRFKDEDVSLRKFDDQKWKKVVGSTDYRENRARQRERSRQSQDSLALSEEELERQRMQEEEQESSSSSIDLPFAGPILEFIFYGIAIALIAAILYFILKNVSFKSAPKKINPDDTGDPSDVEDISELDVDSLLAKTLAAGDYRMALRMSFLGLLKKLNESGFILWKKDKTNREYLTELYLKAKYYNEVRSLTLEYEKVWYGEHAIPAELYHQLKAEFNVIDQQLTAARPQ